MLKIDIMGFGFAGRNLHFRCLNKMLKMGWENLINPNMGAVDINVTTDSNDFITFKSSLDKISTQESMFRVLHITTPPQNHFDNIKDALRKGYRQIIVEKPVVSNQNEIDQVIALEKFYNAKVLVIGNWVSSSVVSHIENELKSKYYGKIKEVTIVQNKSRFIRSCNRSNENIFDIEMPHQIALALYLCGPAIVQSSEIDDMVLPNKIIPNLGIANLKLKHNDVISTLSSSLIHPVRERFVKILTDKGYCIVGYFPTSGDDSYSRMCIYDSCSNELVNKIVFDDPLTFCIIKSYKYFLKCHQIPDSPKPLGMSLNFNKQKVEILEEAKKLASKKSKLPYFINSSIFDKGAFNNASAVL